MMATSKAIPAGFTVLARTDAFNKLFGETYSKECNGELIFGFKVGKHHLNEMGALHGGAIATFADYQVIPASKLAGIDSESYGPTISLTTDYLAPGKMGDWVELHVRLQKRTKSMLFTTGEITVDGEIIARTSGIYRVKSAS